MKEYNYLQYIRFSWRNEKYLNKLIYRTQRERVQELLETTNRYLERAQAAEARIKELEEVIEAYQDNANSWF